MCLVVLVPRSAIPTPDDPMPNTETFRERLIRRYNRRRQIFSAVGNMIFGKHGTSDSYMKLPSPELPVYTPPKSPIELKA